MTELFAMPLRLLRLLATSTVMALDQIWANKMRSVLTTLGIVIGVASVVAVVSALSGYRSYVLSEFESIGTNKIFVFPNVPDEGRFKNAHWHQIRFEPEQFDDILEHCPSVGAFTRVGNRNVDVASGDRQLEGVNVQGVEPDWHEIEGRWPEYGRPFLYIDNAGARPVCLINDKARDDLRLKRDPVGQSVTIEGRRFTVIGLVETKTQAFGFGRSASAEVYIPFNTAWRMWRPWVSGVATSRSPELSEDARAEIRFFLRRTRELRPDDPDTFLIEVVEQFLEIFKNVANVATTVAACIVAISLVVGGIGIMNIMLVSVSERTREIGLRKAVGAQPRVILLQFLVEAVALSALGGALGLAGGQVLVWIMQAIPKTGLDKAFIPLWAVWLAFGFSGATGVAFGIFPAIKASRKDPIEALRHE